MKTRQQKKKMAVYYKMDELKRGATQDVKEEEGMVSYIIPSNTEADIPMENDQENTPDYALARESEKIMSNVYDQIKLSNQLMEEEEKKGGEEQHSPTQEEIADALSSSGANKEKEDVTSSDIDEDDDDDDGERPFQMKQVIQINDQTPSAYNILAIRLISFILSPFLFFQSNNWINAFEFIFSEREQEIINKNPKKKLFQEPNYIIYKVKSAARFNLFKGLAQDKNERKVRAAWKDQLFAQIPVSEGADISQLFDEYLQLEEKNRKDSALTQLMKTNRSDFRNNFKNSFLLNPDTFAKMKAIMPKFQTGCTEVMLYLLEQKGKCQKSRVPFKAEKELQYFQNVMNYVEEFNKVNDQHEFDSTFVSFFDVHYYLFVSTNAEDMFVVATITFANFVVDVEVYRPQKYKAQIEGKTYEGYSFQQQSGRLSLHGHLHTKNVKSEEEFLAQMYRFDASMQKNEDNVHLAQFLAQYRSHFASLYHQLFIRENIIFFPRALNTAITNDLMELVKKQFTKNKIDRGFELLQAAFDIVDEESIDKASLIRGLAVLEEEDDDSNDSSNEIKKASSARLQFANAKVNNFFKNKEKKDDNKKKRFDFIKSNKK